MAQVEQTETNLWGLFDLTPMREGGLQVFLEVTLEKCALGFHASGASVFLRNEDDLFMLRAKTGRLALMPSDSIIEFDSGIAGRALAERKARIVVGQSTLGQGPDGTVASAMVIPLIDPENRPVGVLNLSRSADEDEFNDNDLSKAQAFASLIALAIANAHLMNDAQNALDKAELRNETLRGVMDSIGAAVMVIDGEGRIIDRNRQTDLLLSSVSRAPGFNEVVDKMATATLQSGGVRTARVFDSRSDRTWTLYAVALSNGSVVLTVQEVSEHVHAQREMARVRRLAEIGQMTAAIAHEIRNPLTGIRSAAQMIRTSPDMAAEMGAVIEDETLRLNGLCESFLEFARPIELNLEPCDLGSIAQRVERLEKPAYDEEDKNLSIVLSDALPTKPMDAGRIQQVMLNLVRNAREASRPGSSVVLTLRPDGFSVQDSGIGMDEGQIGQLFSPFFTTKPHGTGLGLSTARKIVDAHGGEIEVISHPGQGTTFDVRLVRTPATPIES
ncbi:MAG: GAF domain-containing protein [Fimbriimonadaceae bacterium]|nr:GAF domain-containing protein [Fimbriimonadaceae bacterium]